MRLGSDQVANDARGRWDDIFYNLNIDVGQGKHKSCPACGGKDRFRFDNKEGDGTYICNQCGAGNGFSLIMKCKGVAFPMALKMVAGFTGTMPMPDDDKERNIKKDEINKIKRLLNTLWESSIILNANDPVMQYLRGRKIILQPENVRYCASCYESDTKKNHPAMISRIQNKSGKPISLFRTYLDGNKKATLENPKKIMPNTEKLNGSAIRLLTPGDMFNSDTLGIAEGVETALSVAQIFQVATWATTGTALLESFNPPDEIKKIIIFGDNDQNYAGQKAAYALANRLFLKPYEKIVEVKFPEHCGDWNDVLIKLSEQGKAVRS